MRKPIAKPFRRLILVGIGMATLGLAGCAPPVYSVRPSSEPAQPPPSTRIYFYPKQGQSREQQRRDRYECYLWAVRKTHFDPSQARLAPHQRVEVTPVAPPGTDTASGAMTGAVVGSMLSDPRDSGEGMVFGAIAGAILGHASDQARQQQAQQLQEQYNSRNDEHYARLDQQARDYRRAMTACLEGRGYTVR